MMISILLFASGMAFGTFICRVVSDVRSGVWDPPIASSTLPPATARSIKRARLDAKADLRRVLPGDRVFLGRRS